MTKFISLKKVVTLGALFSVIAGSSAYAHYYSSGYDLYSIKYRVIDSAGNTAWSTAGSNWAKAVGTGFSQSSTSLNQAHYGEYSYEWFGLYSPNSTPATYFSVYVNTKAIHEYSGCNSNPGACAISTATHEFGHAQFLNDIESGYGDSSIMSYERDRTKITTPQQHDINDINSYRDSAAAAALSESTTPLYNPIANADWPQFNFDQLIGQEAELVVQAKVVDTKVKPKKEGEPRAQLATLKVKKTLFGQAPSEIVLDQALDYVEPGKSYIFVLRKKGDYYYERDGNSIIPEVNGKFISKIPGFKGEFTDEDFNTQFAQKANALKSK